MGRAPCCEKMGLKRGPWTPDEDQILVSYILQHGHSNWRSLPKYAGLLRCGKSCRLRWINYLKPDIKRGNFSLEEEDAIIQLHQLLGNRWSTIAAKLPGRTDNEIKNVWHTHLKKRLPKPESNFSSDTSTTNEVTEWPDRKRVRKCKASKEEKIPKKLKLTPRNCKNQNSDKNNDNNNNASSSGSDITKNGEKHAKSMTRDPICPQPCTSEMSTITSTSENEIQCEENVGEKDDCFDDFWMEILSVEDTAISTQNLPCISQYDQNTSLGPLMMEPIRLNSSSNIDDEEDVDFCWYNFFTRSNELLD